MDPEAKVGAQPQSAEDDGYRRTTPTQEAWRRLRRNKGAMIGLGICIILLLTAVFAPLIAPYDYSTQDRSRAWEPPGRENLMGTDMFGRDMFSRIIYGSRLSLSVGFVAVGIATVGGLILGLLAGFYRGWLETFIMGLAEIMLAFPGILLALGIISILGPNLRNLMIAVGLSTLPRYIRVVRGSTLSVTEEAYVDAAHTNGCGDIRIMLKHVLPNVLGPVIILSTMGIGGAILVGASMSYLGLGAQPPMPEWGTLLSGGRNHMLRAWWITAFPGVAIMITVLAINLLGDGLRDALDPRMKI